MNVNSCHLDLSTSKLSGMCLEYSSNVYQATIKGRSVTVWCAEAENEVIGAYFFEIKSVTGKTYKMASVVQWALAILKVPKNIFNRMVHFPHLSGLVLQYLDLKYLSRCNPRAGLIHWPPCSLYFTPREYFDYLLWQNLKDVVNH